MYRSLALLAIATGIAVPATAQSTAHVVFRNGGSVTGHYVNDGRYYVGDYSGTVNGQLVTLNCVDFFHDVSNGQVWDAKVTNLASGTFAGTYYGNQQAYQEAAFLSTFYQGASNQTTVDLQHAIWRIVGGEMKQRYGADSLSLFTPGADAWIRCAETKYASGYDCDGNPHQVNYQGFQILSDMNGNRQEFLTSTVPEPRSAALLATGLVVLIPLLGRRRK